MTTDDQPPDPQRDWRMAEPRLGKARLSKYVGKMRHGIVVDVTSIRHERMVAYVETDWGLSRQMFCHHLDFGYEFRTKGGEWLPEHDLRALRWLERVRAELAAGKPPRHVGDYGHKLDVETVVMILRRNAGLRRVVHYPTVGSCETNPARKMQVSPLDSAAVGFQRPPRPCPAEPRSSSPSAPRRKRKKPSAN